jgi:hypothetical protein
MAMMMDRPGPRLTGQVSKITSGPPRPADDRARGSWSHEPQNLSETYGVNFTVITSPSATT